MKPYGKKVRFIGLNNKLTPADGRDMSPYIFFLHDLGHAVRVTDLDGPELPTYVRQEINRLPKSQREIAWDIFYEVTYEKGKTLRDLVNNRFIETIELPGISREDVSEGQATLIRIIKSNPYVRILKLLFLGVSCNDMQKSCRFIKI